MWCCKLEPRPFHWHRHNSGLTIRSSRTRFVTWFKCFVVPLPHLTGSYVAGRLNSGVRPHKAGTGVWRHQGCCSVIVPACFWFAALCCSTAWRSSCVVVSRLRFVAPMLGDRGAVTVLSESSPGRRYSQRGAASASHATSLASAQQLPNNSFKPNPLRYLV